MGNAKYILPKPDFTFWEDALIWFIAFAFAGGVASQFVHALAIQILNFTTIGFAGLLAVSCKLASMRSTTVRPKAKAN
jgi:hypothetical protein